MNPRSAHHSFKALPRSCRDVALFMTMWAPSFLVSNAGQRIRLMLVAACASSVMWTRGRQHVLPVAEHLQLLANCVLVLGVFGSRIGVKRRQSFHKIVARASLDGR